MPGQLAQRAAFWCTYWPSFHLATFAFGLRVVGRENVPPTGPLIYAANHLSFIDPWLVGQSSPRRPSFLARHTLFDVPVLGPVIRAYGSVPIDRGFGKDGLQTVLNLLRTGAAVVVFPEGERSLTGDMLPLKPGVALLLKKADCPVVPVGIAGAFRMWPRRAKWPAPEPLVGPARDRSVALAFGEPIPAGTFAKADRDAILARVTAGITDAVATAEGVRRKP